MGWPHCLQPWQEAPSKFVTQEINTQKTQERQQQQQQKVSVPMGQGLQGESRGSPSQQEASNSREEGPSYSSPDSSCRSA